MAEKKSMAGTHKARARESALGVTESDSPKEYIGVMFEITSGDLKGKSISWRGFFSDNAVVRTLESLRHCGWTGETLADMTGLGDREVEIVVEPEEYNGKTHDRVRWVNRPAQLLMNRMSDQAARSFAERMARLTADSKRNYGPMPAAARSGAVAPDNAYDGPEDDAIPF